MCFMLDEHVISPQASWVKHEGHGWEMASACEEFIKVIQVMAMISLEKFTAYSQRRNYLLNKMILLVIN